MEIEALDSINSSVVLEVSPTHIINHEGNWIFKIASISYIISFNKKTRVEHLLYCADISWLVWGMYKWYQYKYE